jgi:hypothetical protein
VPISWKVAIGVILNKAVLQAGILRGGYMANVTVQTGAVSGSSNGKIASSSSFNFLNTDTTQSVLVSNVQDWCVNSSYNVPQAQSATSPGSITATTKNVAGSFSYSSSAYNAPGRPSISIGSK